MISSNSLRSNFNFARPEPRLRADPLACTNNTMHCYHTSCASDLLLIAKYRESTSVTLNTQK